MYDTFIIPEAAKFLGGRAFTATEITDMVHRTWDRPHFGPPVSSFLDRNAVKRFLDRRAEPHHGSGIEKVAPSTYRWPAVTDWDHMVFRQIAEEDQRLATLVTQLLSAARQGL